MTVLHSGTSKKYSDNWERAFQKNKSAGAKNASASKKASDKKSSKGKK